MEKNKVNMDFKPTQEEAQEYLAYKSEKDVFNNLSDGLSTLDNWEFESGNKKIKVVAGAMVAFDKGTIQFLNKLVKADTSYRYILLSEVTAENRRKTNECMEMEWICTPHLLAKEMRLSYFAVSVSEEIKEYVEQRDYLIKARKNLLARHKDMEESYATIFVYYAELYILKLIEKVRPSIVILWNEFYAFHTIFAQICKKNHIKVQYMEFGCVPGTFVIEQEGQQGESYSAKHPWRFRCLPVSYQNLETAEKVVKYIYEKRLNRNVQPLFGRLDQVLCKNKMGKPIVTYFGQNDYESGLYPYTEITNRYHSPFLKSSVEGLETLRLLAIKNDWTLLYKPHPLMENIGAEAIAEPQRGCVYLRDINIHELIDYSDVVVTILSQSAYETLFRGKPVVMLGYTQLRGAGVVYEAYRSHRVEKEIKLAIRRGYTWRKKRCFQRHLAQLLKYCLLDDLSHPEFPYGMNMKEFVAKWNRNDIF